MNTYSLSHLGDQELDRGVASAIGQEYGATAMALAYIAESDARKRYVPAGYPSMFACVGALRLSEDAAYRRITAARTARRFPAIFHAVADSRLHLSAVCLLAPYLTPENADELLAAATHQSKSEIERRLAARFPRPGLLAWVEEIPASSLLGSPEQQAPGPIDGNRQLVPGRVGETRQRVPERAGDRARVQPLAAGCFGVQFNLSQNGYDNLCYAQELLGHQVPSGDIAQIFERSLEAFVEKLEKAKFAATSRPRRSVRPSANPRYIPAEVKRAVRKRDGGQCTFVSEAGHRCPARTRLEFDHVQEVARGGRATVAGVRLRCRAHNEECSSRAWRGSDELNQARTSERHAGKNALN